MAFKGKDHNYAIKSAFKTMNNEVEYEALLSRLQVARTLRATKIKVWADSQVVVNQVRGQFVAKSEKLMRYLALVEAKCPHFKYF